MKNISLLYTSVFLFVFFISCNKKFNGSGTLKKHKIEFAGKTREYWVYLPKDYNSSKTYSLLLGLHGRGGDGKNAIKFMKFNPLADKYNFICIYPSGYKRSWNDGRNKTPASKAGIDDVAFLDFLISEIQKEYSVNEKKIYAVGMSNGGYMALTLACGLSQRFAAVASVTGIMAPNPETWCKPQQAIPVLLIGGTDDPIVPYKGGKISNGIETIGFDEAFNFWKKQNVCIGNSKSISLANNSKDGTTVEVETYNFCNNNSEVILYRIIGGGHTWPGGSQYLPQAAIGRLCKEFKAEEIIIEFLIKHELP
jgi:polyhydroxybutyrate depolymerase